MRGSGRQIAGNPVLIGAATVLVVLVAVFLAYNANQGLPFVPTYNLKAELPSAANLVRGNEVRIGGTRVGSVDRSASSGGTTGTNIALLGAQARALGRPAADGLDADRPAALRARPEVREITRGTSDEGFEDGATIPLAQRHARAGRVRRVREHVRRRHPRGRAARTCNGFGDALAGPRHEHQPGDRRVPPAAARRHPGRAQPRQPRDRPAALRPLARPHRRDRRAGGRGAGAAVRQPRRDVRRAAQRRAPFIQESITEGPATLDAAIEQFPLQRPFLANTDGAVPRAAAGRRGAADRGAGPRRRASRSARRSLRRSPPFNRRLASLLESVGEFAADPLVPQGINRLTADDGAARTRRCASSRRRRRPATTSRCSFRNIASLLSEGDANGTWQRFIIVATPQGPNNEGGPSSAPAERADGRQPPARQPLPEHGGAGPAEGVRGGQRDATGPAAR